MKVELISYTDDAVNLLLFTKNTRLMDDDNAYEKVSKWPWDKKQDELDYMLKTIKSSWEFIDYTFNVLHPPVRSHSSRLIRPTIATHS